MAHTLGPLTIKKGNYICKDDRAIGIAFNLRITEFGQSILPGRDNARLWAAAPDLLAACKHEGNRSDVLLAAATLLEMNKFSEIAAILREKAKLERVAIARAEGTAPTCSACDSVFQDGDPQRTGDDGEPLCGGCYAERYGARDRADEPWVRGDAEYDESRVRDG